MSNLSLYWTLFKKFQSMGHVAEGTYHGSMGGTAGVSFMNPTALLTMQHAGINLLGASTADSPLWMVLNARANMQTMPFEYPLASGIMWTPMPHPMMGGAAAAAWADFGGPPLVQALGNWIAAGKPNDFPAFIVIPNGGTVPGPLDVGAATPFVCSYATDDGTVGAGSANFLDTSLIYMGNGDGTQATASNLHHAAEYIVAAS